MGERVRIGELLVETGLISQSQLSQALEIQSRDPRRLGEIVVSEGMVSEAKVTQILSQQLSVPWVSLEYVDFSRQLLNLVPSDLAQAHTLVPIYVRRSKQRRETLYVAIEDPSNDEALELVADFSGLPVRPMIAPPSDIRAAIRAYYLGLPPESSGPKPIKQSVSSRPEPMDAEEALTRENSAPPPPDAADEPEGEPPESVDLKARDSKMPDPSSQSSDSPKMITLTMLDGTQMKLPASVSKTAGDGPALELTARDLVEALRAEAGGADLSEVLGAEVNWQRMFAALLSLMLKKHLVMDWEFVRELKR